MDTQIPRLLRRYTLVHNAVLATYCAVLLHVVTMFAIAGAYAYQSCTWATLTLVPATFLAGRGMMLGGIGLLAVYVVGSNTSVQHAPRRVLGLGK